MLNDKKEENGFLDALNNIDDDLVEEVTENPVRPSKIEYAPKKSRVMRVAAAAASLAAMAAVSIGALIVMQKLPFSPPAEQTSENTTPVSENTSESTVGKETDVSTEQPVHSTAITTAPGNNAEKYSYAEEVLSQNDWKYISHYVDATNEEGYLRISSFDNFNIENIDTQTGMTVGVLFDKKRCGEYEIALLGFKVWTDNINFANGVVGAKELRIALVKSDRIIDTVPVYSPLSPDALLVQLDKRFFDSFTEVIDNRIVIFRALSSQRIPEALFFFIGNETILPCKRGDLPSDVKREDRSEALSPLLEASCYELDTEGAGVDYFIIDKLTRTVYNFNSHSLDGYFHYTYTKGTESYATTGSVMFMFQKLDPDKLPVIEDFYYGNVGDLIDSLARDVLICEKTVGDYTLSLVGQNLWRNKDGLIYLYNPQTLITIKGEGFVRSVSTNLPTMIPYQAAIVYSNNGDYSGYGMNAYMLGDTLLLFDNTLNSGKYEEERFYAVKGDRIYTLNGNYDGVKGKPPSWTESKDGYDLIVDAENQTVIYGFRQYKFELDKATDSEYSYTVSWLDKPVE